MVRMLIPAALIAAAVASPALADRGPSREEAAAIAAKLTEAGFKSWNKVEFDEDGPIWKVDDARTIEGKTYDLQLDPTHYGIVKKDGD
ncbi:PepSY domain-containing protein [Sphingomonas crocodyli]|nr:PepSY domain-containing protein [Sphingomonas crocodyli]